MLTKTHLQALRKLALRISEAEFHDNSTENDKGRTMRSPFLCAGMQSPESNYAGKKDIAGRTTAVREITSTKASNIFSGHQ